MLWMLFQSCNRETHDPSWPHIRTDKTLFGLPVCPCPCDFAKDHVFLCTRPCMCAGTFKSSYGRLPSFPLSCGTRSPPCIWVTSGGESVGLYVFLTCAGRHQKLNIFLSLIVWRKMGVFRFSQHVHSIQIFNNGVTYKSFLTSLNCFSLSKRHLLKT